jgi:DNA invertase Pin-like site-specific DNA recombinase
MLAGNSTRPARTVAYYRMSTDRQEDSIPQQQEWAARACRREGAEVVREFSDPGIAGDEIALRPGLQAMIEFCEQRWKAGDPVDAVATWDADRFSRADSIRTAALLCRLMDAGVSRMLTAEGWVDFDDVTDRVLHAVKQDLGRAAYSQSLSANVSRSCLARAREGKWNGGRVPFAYVVGPDHFLAPGDPAEVEAVRALFALVASGMSAVRVARELERLGAPRPKYGSRRWTKSTVYGIVTNLKYTGAMDYGNLHQGKYHECSAGGVRKRHRAPKTAAGRRRQVGAPPGDVVVVENTHPALVDRDLWERAQRALAANRMECRTGDKQKRRYHKWPLSGLAYCQHCGGRMYGAFAPGRRGAKVGVRRYVCGTYRVQGRAGCANNWMREDELIPLVFDAVRQALSNPEGIRHARRELEAEAEECHRAGTGFAQALRHRADELAAKVVGALDRMALLPADLVEDMARSVRGCEGGAGEAPGRGAAVGGDRGPRPGRPSPGGGRDGGAPAAGRVDGRARVGRGAVGPEDRGAGRTGGPPGAALRDAGPRPQAAGELLRGGQRPLPEGGRTVRPSKGKWSRTDSSGRPMTLLTLPDTTRTYGSSCSRMA